MNQAQEAKVKTEKAEVEEQIKIAKMNALTHEEKWIYTTGDGKEVPIPAGCAPTEINGENRVDEGLVIVDGEGNEFVWIEVPKNNDIYETTTTSVTNFDSNFYINIEKDLKKYVNDYREGRENSSDNWQENCKLDKEKYTTLKNSMLKSIYVNEGFWIGRYEVGYEGEVRYNENNYYLEEINKNPVIKEGAYPLNYVCYPQAQRLSNKITYGEYEGSLMFGIQFDLACKFIEVNNGKNKDEIKYDCISWGNYRDSIFEVTKGKYSEDGGKTFNDVSGKYKKGSYEAGKGVLLTTGATNRNSILNIYDLAGNLFEFSLEFNMGGDIKYSTLRGGSCLSGRKRLDARRREYR